MKKLGLVAALALFTTVGGVYAAWQYAGGEKATNASADKYLTVTQATESGASGLLNITLPTVIKIDDVGSLDANDELPNYTPGWSEDSNGSFVFTFTPNTGAGVTTLKYVVTLSNNTYLDDGATEVKIFNVEDADPDTDGVQIVGTFTYDPAIPGSNVKTVALNELLPVNQTYTVGTYAEHTEYSRVLNGVKIDVVLSEVE